MEQKVVLEQGAFKALASPTRISILKTLSQRRHTQSELAAVHKLSIPTVKEHLTALEHGGLVNRYDEGRKWIYYGLSEKARCILDPERKRLWIVLGMFVLSGVGVMASFARYAKMLPPVAMQLKSERMIEAAAESADMLAQIAPSAPEAVQVSAPYPLWPVLFSVISSILLLVLVYYLVRVLRRKA